MIANIAAGFIAAAIAGASLVMFKEWRRDARSD
jgi:hypothetical protein